MPEYDYKCKNCGNIFTKQVKRIADKDDALKDDCPSCGSKNTLYIAIIDTVPFMYTNTMTGKNLNSDYRSFLSNVKKNNPKSTIKDY